MGKTTIFYSTVAGIQTTASVANFVEYAVQKTAALQDHLSRAPELTDKVIEAANDAVKNVSSGNLYTGIAFGVAAGFFAGMALYDASRREE